MVISRLFVLAALAFLPVRPAAAASSFAGEYLALGAGARALALGNAYVALVDDATAGYWNAAALATLDERQAHAMHAERFSGLVDQDFFALALPKVGLDGLSFSLLRVGVPDIQATALQDPGRPLGPDNRPVVSSTFTSADYAFYLSGGQRLSQRLDLGASLKFLYNDVGSFASGYGVGLDLGLRLRLGPGVVLAANIRDITTTPIFWDTKSTDHIQPSILTGIAYTRPVAAGRFTAAFSSRAGGDAEDQSGDDPLNFGVEYGYKNIALRAGLEENRQSYGLGIRPHEHLDLDMAFLDHNELEGTYLFSAGFRF